MLLLLPPPLLLAHTAFHAHWGGLDPACLRAAGFSGAPGDVREKMKTAVAQATRLKDCNAQA
eukprot:5533262-Alexandrium_andersonii.AAC.1